jgi:hypothetical protein
MKRKIVALLVAVGLVGLPLVPSWAVTLSDDELGSVSARGFQIVHNGPVNIGQDNNNDSVQIASNSQKMVHGLAVTNAADSGGSVGQNIASAYDLIGFNGISQENVQFALNEPAASEQYVLNNPFGLFDLSAFQDNNNGSVQVKDDAQNWVSALVLSNAALSATTVGQNIASAGNLAFGDLFVQRNYQTAKNDVHKDKQSVVNGGFLLGIDAFQDNNNGSVQVTDAQQGGSHAGFMVLANIADSAANVAQNIANGKDAALMSIASQKNWQKAYNDTYTKQSVDSGFSYLSASIFQASNNGSVQISDRAQQWLSAMVIANAASSATNAGQNVASLGSFVSLNFVEQLNHQKADNDTYVSQKVKNIGLLEVSALQDNNNGSVQVAHAQDWASALTLSHAADSAANVGQNIVASGDFVGLDIVSQKNDQHAKSDTKSKQAVVNLFASLPLAQDNNNASVQMNDSQSHVRGLSVLNAAASAVNVGQNIATVYNAYSGITAVEQVNEQKAFNGGIRFWDDSKADQFVVSLASLAQDNNNASVQLNDSQNHAAGLSIVNAAMSAVNVGQNITSVTGLLPLGTTMHQKNIQFAYNNVDTDQVVVTGCSFDQDNNNGSVQLNNSQKHTQGLTIANVAGSAFNAGLNIGSVWGITGLTGIVQTNCQTAINR